MDYPLVNRGHKQLVGKIAKMTFFDFQGKVRTTVWYHAYTTGWWLHSFISTMIVMMIRNDHHQLMERIRLLWVFFKWEIISTLPPVTVFSIHPNKTLGTS